MHLLSLNDDVLHAIASFLATRDALRFCATSREIYSLAIRHALAYVTLDRSPKHTMEFFEFMLQSDDRPVWLRVLVVTRSAIGHRQVWRVTLGDLLERASNLRRLSVGLSEHSTTYDVRLPAACVALPDLIKLELWRGGNRVLDMLAKMPPMSRHLRSLTLELHDLVPDIPFHRIFGIISQFPRLETLRIDKFGTRIIMPSPLLTDLRIYNVHTLQLAYGSLPMTLAMQVFPDLQELTFYSIENGSEHQPQDIATFGSPQGLKKGGWERLHHIQTSFKGSVGEDLWRVPLSHVRWLDLTSMAAQRSGDVSCIDAALGSVERTCPRVLSVQSGIVNLRFWENLPEIAPQLRYLELDLVPLGVDIHTALESWQLESSVAHLCALPILGMLFCIRICDITPDISAHAHTTAITIVHALASSNASIRYIGVSIYGWPSEMNIGGDLPPSHEERRPATWWKVVDVGDGSSKKEPRQLAAGADARLREYFYGADYESPSVVDGMPIF
ncbi:hypothetical protein A0H81_14829 [Grifola frondosa]|uniref:F-box domain-containing protein n=1 Tax=Grifola frondosa TaxID=5627 RepID=A0A1C7LK62_GRIFR|nr:hypothetical protein A0H81_14829 [Grifola frondosa]